MMYLEDWVLVTKKRGTFVTPEMIKNPKLNIQKVVFVGKMFENENNKVKANINGNMSGSERGSERRYEAERRCFKSGAVKKINKNQVVTETGSFYLGTPSNEYLEFVKAINQDLPIVINWVIGKNNMLSANIYEKGKIKYVCERVISQNISSRTIFLENGKTVYVVWRNMNSKMVRHLLAIKDWMDLYKLFPTPEFPFQMDVEQTSQKIWMYKTEPYEWIFNSPHNFSILNEDIQTRREKKKEIVIENWSVPIWFN